MIRVAVAIIYNQENKILITKRGYNSTHPGKWELPGGKIINNETPEHALYREIKEEVGLFINSYEFFTKLEYSYPDQNKDKKDISLLSKLEPDAKYANNHSPEQSYTDVELFIYKVQDYTGYATCLESQLALEWVDPKQLSNYDILEANYQIINLL